MGSIEVYHGSPNEFGEFRAAKGGARTPRRQLDFGVHGTEDRSFADKFGRYLYTLRFTWEDLLDATQVYEKGTREFELGVALYKGTPMAHNGHYFRMKGITPIALDVTSSARAMRLLKEYGFDAVKYNAVVTRGQHRVADAVSYVVLDPEQVEILDVEDQGEGTKKEYNPRRVNPYAYDTRDEKILAWGFLDPYGHLITEPEGYEEDLEHNGLAEEVLHMDFQEAIVEEGYTRVLVSQFVSGNTSTPVQGGFRFYSQNTSAPTAIRRYLTDTHLNIEKVEIEVCNAYDLDGRDDGYFYGDTKKGIAWLREYTPPEDEG